MRTELRAHVLGDGFLAARTTRALRRLGIDVEPELAAARGPLWILRAGAIPLACPTPPARSATGRLLLAFGAAHGDAEWSAIVSASGNDLSSFAPRTVDSVWVEDAHALPRGVGLARACADLVRDGARAVRIPAFDVEVDPALRVLVAVTTLHRGGAERIAIDLVRSLRERGHLATLAVVDRATRDVLEAPSGTVFVAEHARTRAERITAVGELAIAGGFDLVHAHLLDGDETRLLGQSGVPVAVTLHNDRAGWPARILPLDVPLAIGCSRQVTAELERAGVANARTIWNGIAPPPPPPRRTTGALVLLAIANHRPQKRLERLPAIVAELVRRGEDVRLRIAGEPVKNDPASVAVAGAIAGEAERHGVSDRIELLGARRDVAELLAGADVVVSTSAFEGLSLVHLEALAAGLPLVATRVSGTSEIAAKHPAARLVEPEASATAFADAILDARGKASELAPDFTTRAMTKRHLELYERAVVPRRRGDGILLVTNNFSTGGAQSSARRLLLALASAGVRVRACVIEEQRDWPTPGRAALERAGIPVDVAPRAGSVDPAVTARAVVDLVDREAPAAVLFWNVIPEHKVLVADRLLGVPVWDVSPGEMYFASFARYLARPRVGLPYLDLRDYGGLLAGTIVKYEGERQRAEDALGTSVHVIANGVDVPARPLRRVQRRGPIVIGTLARIGPDKKLEQLVDAARALPHDLDYELPIAGGIEDEAYAAMLRERAAGLPIVFVGEQDSRTFLAELDVFAMVSEPCGCPNASLEAMAAGLPIAATDAGGARDQLAHGVHGLLSPRGDAQGLASSIHALCTDPALRERLGDAAHARAIAHFSVERMAADYARVCLGLDLAKRISMAAE